MISRDRRPLIAWAAIGLLFVALTLTTSARIPPLEAADEAAHLLYVHHLLETGTLPVIRDRDAIDALAVSGDVIGQWSLQSHHPPLYYALGALIGGGIPRDDLPELLRPNELIFTRGITAGNANQWLHPPGVATDGTLTLVAVLRGVSITLSLGTLGFVYLSGRMLGGASLGLAAALLTASLPTFVSISGSVNNDNLIVLLYSAGVYLSLRTLRDGPSPGVTAALALVLTLAALTKITGLSLFGVVALALLMRVLRGQTTWRVAARHFGAMLAAAALGAGWWYLRNWTLYGDPLALTATASIWGRAYGVGSESGDLFTEAWRLWRSFWMMTGHLHQPVYGPPWFYAYTLILAGTALVGALIPGRHDSRRFDGMLLAAVGGLVTAQLLVGTRSVDITYGRLLFPALTAFAPLIVLGLRRWNRQAVLLVLPLTLMSILAAVRELPDAYPPLTPVEALPADVVPVGVDTGGLHIVGYRLHTESAAPGDAIRAELYIKGRHPQNPALVATLIDPISGEPRGGRIVYPGTAPTDSLSADTLYHTPLRIPLNTGRSTLCPRRLRVQLGWQTVLGVDAYLPMTDAAGSPLPALLLDSAVLLDPRCDPPTLPHAADVRFGTGIVLRGWESAQAGDAVTVRLRWAYAGPTDLDYSLTVQALSLAGDLLAQADGPLPGYPTSAWRPGPDSLDARTLTLPPGTGPDGYTLWVGWYRQDDFTRLTVDHPAAINELWPLATE